MNTHTDNSPQFGAQGAAVLADTRPLYWSIRREVWENRSVYLAPLIVTAVVLFATMISTMTLPRRLRNADDPARQRTVVAAPFSMAPAPIMLASLLVGVFYSMDALYGERRDRSILFWKSLPVSDRTTVLSKAAIPLVVLPVFALALSIVTQLILVLLSTMVLLGNGINPAPMWTEYRFIQGSLVMMYGLTVHILWFAPIYAWLLLVSAWARRAPLLWAVMPVLVIGAMERIAFRTPYFMSMIRYRFMGAMSEAFTVRIPNKQAIDRFSQLDPLRYLSTPGLWVGLIFAAACLAAAVRLRRNREPI